jgi:BolA family transcriptional regulator, general stress-responsive regulator
MTVADRIRDKLTAGLTPAQLVVKDESKRHAGHAGARPEGETHFRVRVVSDRFEGVGRIDRQRLVHTLLADELAAGVHALTIAAMTPAEAAAKT